MALAKPLSLRLHPEVVHVAQVLRGHVLDVNKSAEQGHDCNNIQYTRMNKYAKDSSCSYDLSEQKSQS